MLSIQHLLEGIGMWQKASAVLQSTAERITQESIQCNLHSIFHYQQATVPFQ